MKLSIILTIVGLLLFASCGKKEITAKDYINDLKNDKKQSKALIELEKLGPKAKSAIPALMDLLKKDEKNSAKNALRIITKIGDEPQIIAAAKVGINSKNKSVTTSSINALKKLKKKTPEVYKIIVEGITSTEQFTRQEAIIAAGQLKVKQAVAPLIKVLVNSSTTQHIILNKQAARSLGQIGDPKAIPALIKGLFIKKNVKGTNNKGTAFVSARNALYEFGEAALKEIINTLNGKNEDFNKFKKANPMIKSSDITYNLIVMINELGNESVYPILEKYMNSKDHGVKLQAEAGMGSIGIKKAVPVLIKKYAKLKKQIVKESDEQKLAQEVQEATNINRMLAMIGGKAAEKHLVKEMLSKPLKIDGEEYNDLKDDAISSFSNFAGAKYYKTYQKIWTTEKNVNRKKNMMLYLKIMEVANDCKEDVKCYAKYFDKKKNPKPKGKLLKELTKELGTIQMAKSLPVFKRQKAAYMLSHFNTPESKKIAFEKALFDKDPGVRNAGAFTIDRLGTKADVPALEAVLKKAKKKSYLKKAISLYEKLLAKLKNR